MFLPSGADFPSGENFISAYFLETEMIFEISIYKSCKTQDKNLTKALKMTEHDLRLPIVTKGHSNLPNQRPPPLPEKIINFYILY